MTIKRIKIGIFDSGLGGLSILKEIQLKVPNSIIYYCSDKNNLPYGNKEPTFIQQRCVELTEKLLAQDVDIVIVACNTATAYGIEYLRENFNIPFIGVEPYINYVNKSEVENQRVAVLTTVATGKSERFLKLKKRLDPNNKIDHFMLPHLAMIIEDQIYSHQRLNHKIEQELSDIPRNTYSHFILGCTHYPLIRDYLTELLNAQMVCPSPAISKRVIDVLGINENSLNSDVHKDLFFFAGNADECFTEVSLKSLLKI